MTHDLIIEAFLADVRTYCETAGLSESGLGRRALGNKNWLRRVRRGQGGLTSTTMARVREYILANPAPKAVAGRSASRRAIAPQAAE